jgi:hypothetical protein
MRPRTPIMPAARITRRCRSNTGGQTTRLAMPVSSWKVAVEQGAAEQRRLAALGGGGDPGNQYLLAIVTDRAIEPIGPFLTDAKAALNGR